jgi:hypothetical protein
MVAPFARLLTRARRRPDGGVQKAFGKPACLRISFAVILDFSLRSTTTKILVFGFHQIS